MVMADNIYPVKLVLGDFTDDGHGITKEIRYMSNHDADTIWDAYKESCKKTGLCFNDNNLPDSEGWRQMFTDFDEYDLDERAADVLRDHGIEPADHSGNEGLIFTPDSAAGLIMAFIALSMPDDWTYVLVKDRFEMINKIQMGYGLFE